MKQVKPRSKSQSCNVLDELAIYAISRKKLAAERAVGSSGGCYDNACGEVVAYADVLDWLSNHGIKV